MREKSFILGLFALTLIFSLIAMPVSTMAAQEGDADIIGLQELENNENVAVANQVEALNAATAPGTWNNVPEPPGVAGTNAIKVSIIYQTAKVTPVGDSITDDDPIYDRPPVVQTFDASGEILTVVSNHFKSKGCYDETGLDEDQGDGQSCYNYADFYAIFYRMATSNEIC